MLLKAAESASSGRNARPVTQYTSTAFSPQKMANIATVRTASPHTSLIGPAPFRWTVYRLSFLISCSLILHPNLSLPPLAAEAPGSFG